MTVAGSYALDGEPDRNEQKFYDGNVRVRMAHTTTQLALGDVTVAFDGEAWEVSSASGLHEVGSLFFTNPATYVNHEASVVYGEAAVENMADHFIEGTLDELAITFEYADTQVHTGAAIDVSDGSWTGAFTLRNEAGDEIGTAAATATLTPLGPPTRLFDHVRGGYEKWTFTPYELVLTVDGPVAPARLTVEIAEVSYSIHTPPVTGQHQ